MRDGYGGITVPETRGFRCIDINGFSVRIRRRRIFWFIWVISVILLKRWLLQNYASLTLPVEHEHELSDKPRVASSGAVLVHCDLGISRSPTIIIAYLMRKYGTKFEGALKFVMSKQKLKPSANFTRQLQVWEQVGYQVWEDEERTVPKPPYQAFLDDRAALLKKKGLTGVEPLAPLSR